MIKTPLISVVVAAYNTGKYIEECLNSIISQTFQDWECIIIDDASSDNTLSVIKEFAGKDQRFRYDVLPVNSGSAKVPRDKAVADAKADWILQVDSDDFIDQNVMERLYARAVQTDADIVFLRLKRFEHENPHRFNFLPDKDFDMQCRLTGEEAVMLTIPEWIIPGNGLIRKKLWDMRSTLKTGMNHMNVDEFDGREWFFNANFIVFEDVIYHYRHHSSSITRKISSKLFEMLITDKMVENLVHEKFGKDSPQASIVSQWRINNILEKRCYLSAIGSKLSGVELNRAKKLIREHYRSIDKNHIPYKGVKQMVYRSYILFELYMFYRFASGKILGRLRSYKYMLIGKKHKNR